MNVYWKIVIVLLSIVVCMVAIKLWRVNNHLFQNGSDHVGKKNSKAPVKYTFYPCFVYHTDNEFHWSYTKPWCFIGGNNYPKDEGNVKIEVNCTVEILEYPDGRYSAAWFPGEYREEEA